jgi:hypothetical protein
MMIRACAAHQLRQVAARKAAASAAAAAFAMAAGRVDR